MKKQFNEMKKATALAAAMIVSVSAYAGEGQGVGNGGDGVVCTQLNGSKTVQLLDYYEATTQFKGPQNNQPIQLDLGTPGLKVDEIVDLFLSRIAAISPERAKRYREQTKVFMAEAAFIPNANLEDIPDSKHVVTPDNCEIKQVIIHREPKFRRSLRYTVDKDYWDLMDNGNKAGLILHEVIYREAISSNHSNSIATRYFNGLVAGNLLTAMTDQDAYLLFGELSFGYAEANGLSYLTTDAYFHPNGELRRAYLFGPKEFEIHGFAQFTKAVMEKYAYFDKQGKFSWRELEILNQGSLRYIRAGDRVCPILNAYFFTDCKPVIAVRIKSSGVVLQAPLDYISPSLWQDGFHAATFIAESFKNFAEVKITVRTKPGIFSEKLVTEVRVRRYNEKSFEPAQVITPWVIEYMNEK